MECCMTDRPRLIEPAQMFRRSTPSPHSGGPHGQGTHVPARLLLPPRLIVPASSTVKRSLWVFRTPKSELLKD
jgi:hypothetical protein